MTNRIKRLKPVQDLAARDERQAAMQLGERLGQMEEEQRRLDELLGWQRDYAENMQRVGVSLSELKSYRLFMGRLGEAIDQQKEVLAEVKRGASLAREHWQAQHARHAALSKVVEQCFRDERKAADRLEQHQLDEFNTTRMPSKL